MDTINTAVIKWARGSNWVILQICAGEAVFSNQAFTSFRVKLCVVFVPVPGADCAN